MLRIVTGDVKLMSGGPSAFTIYQQQFYHKNREEIFEFALSLTKPREIRLWTCSCIILLEEYLILKLTNFW